MTAWLNAACAWSVNFAQVREDPLIDQAVADRLRDDSTLLMIASGGCTAAWLARHPRLREITLVDANPAQLALTRLKCRMLVQTAPALRLAMLGHDAIDVAERSRFLAQHLQALHLPADILGSLPAVAALGPDFCGRYEQLFAALQQKIAADPLLSCGTAALFSCNDVSEQTVWLATHPEWWQQLTEQFDALFALSNLVALFGAGATQNRRQDFSRHFLEQLHYLLTHQAIRHNPYVWQMLCGRYPAGHPAPWLSLPAAPVDLHWRYVESTMMDAMQSAIAHGIRYSMLHLSNVLDWLTPAEALATLRAAWACTEPGGWIVIRQLNSALDIDALGKSLGWQSDTASADATALLEQDRSFFYRRLHIWYKP